MDSAIEKRLGELGVGERITLIKKRIPNEYRLLREGEIIKGSDEILSVNKKWKNIEQHHYSALLGTELRCKDFIIRRKIYVDLENEEIGELLDELDFMCHRDIEDFSAWMNLIIKKVEKIMVLRKSING